MSGTALNSSDFNFLDHIIVDSSAIHHIFGNKKLLTQLEQTQNHQHVLVANGMKSQVNGIGKFNFFFKRN